MTIGIEPDTSQIKIQGPTETPGTTQGTGMSTTLTEIEEPMEHTGILETITKIDGMTTEMKPEEITEMKTDGMTTETELEMLEPERIETLRIMFGMTPMSATEIPLEPHTDTITKMLRTDGRTPRIEQDALTEILVIMPLTHGKIPRIPSLKNGRTPKIMLQINGIPSNTSPGTSMKVQRTVPTILLRALEIDGTTIDAIQNRIIIDL